MAGIKDMAETRGMAKKMRYREYQKWKMGLPWSRSGPNTLERAHHILVVTLFIFMLQLRDELLLLYLTISV